MQVGSLQAAHRKVALQSANTRVNSHALQALQRKSTHNPLVHVHARPHGPTYHCPTIFFVPLCFALKKRNHLFVFFFFLSRRGLSLSFSFLLLSRFTSVSKFIFHPKCFMESFKTVKKTAKENQNKKQHCIKE